MNIKIAIALLTLSALLPNEAAVSVNEGLFFDLGFNTAKAPDNKKIGNLMTVGQENGWDYSTQGFPTTISDQDPVKIETAKIQGGYCTYSSVTNEMPILTIPQGTKYDEDDKYYTAQQTVAFADTKPDVDVRSGFVRFRWDGFAFTNRLDIIMVADCWAWASESVNSRGFALGISEQSELNFWVGKTSSKFSACKLVPGQWYDVAFCVTNKTDGTGSDLRLIYATGGTSTLYSVDYNGHVLNMNASSSAKIIKMGGQDLNASGWSEFLPTSSTRRKAFKGAIANIKLWSRALSNEELLAVLAGYNGMQWSIGAKNGSSDEFGDEIVDEFDPVKDKWGKMRKTLDSDNPSLTFKTKMESVDAGLQKSLRVNPILSNGASSAVSLFVNGEYVESANLLNGSEYVFIIPASKWVAGSDGNNITVEIRRTGTVDGTLEFDDISLSGGWQAGIADKKVPALHEKYMPDDFFIGDFDFDNHLKKATVSPVNTQGAETNFYMHFWADERMVKRSDAVFTSMICNKAAKEEKTLFKVYLNDNEIGSADCGKLDTIRVNIPRNTIRVGLNKIEVRNSSERSDEWAQYDYFRLEYSREHLPFAITIR